MNEAPDASRQNSPADSDNTDAGASAQDPDDPCGSIICTAMGDPGDQTPGGCDVEVDVEVGGGDDDDGDGPPDDCDYLGNCSANASGNDPSGGGGGGGGPQTPTPQQPQKKPCTAASRAASTVEALDAAGDALISFNLAAVHFGLAGVLVSAGCLEPTPFEPLTCAASGFGAVSVSAGGGVLTGFGVFQTKRAVSAIKQAVTCGPGS
jgi:hypothetical protein